LGKDDMRPSQVYRLLMNMPDEVLVLLMATAVANRNGQKIRRLRKRLVRFLKHDRSMTTIVKGEDLKELGLKPGPHFKTILERLLNERLDGIVTTKAEERALVLRLAQRSA
jgi:tRNA nucleotidyltransferase (CCA-adding enzyme)